METERRYRGGRVDPSITIGGLPITLWLDAYEHCHNAQEEGEDLFIEWPDGRPYIEQCGMMVEVFGLIRDTRNKVKKTEAEKKSRRGKFRRR